MKTEIIKITKNKKKELIHKTKTPKYLGSIINVINEFSQATRPKVVGQLTEYFKEFKKNNPTGSLNEWKLFYLKKEPNGFKNANKKILEMYNIIKKKIANELNMDVVKNWQEQLIIEKTFIGLSCEYLIGKYLSERFNREFIRSNPSDESKNIDFYLDNIAIQIKPISNKIRQHIVQYKTIIIEYEITGVDKTIEIILDENQLNILNK